MDSYSELKISTHQAEEILYNSYRIKGTAIRLPGYVDYNFKIKTENGDCYILKISRPNADVNYILFLQDILLYLEKNAEELIAPKIVCDKEGNYTSEIFDENKNKQHVRLLTWISGRIWSHVNPRLEGIHFSLGQTCGKITKALQHFEHPQSHIDVEWDTSQSLWTKKYLHLFSDKEREINSYFQNLFEANLETYNQLRKSIVHNDANDYNIIVSEDLVNPEVRSVIDYGDAIYTQIINDVAIACAYAIMDHNDPLEAALPIIKGYHDSFPLQESELEHLYNSIAMRLVISITKSAINKKEFPENEYLLISEKPAWELLNKWRRISPDFAQCTFRSACGFTPHPSEKVFINWTKKNEFKISNLFPSVGKNKLLHLDLSVSSTWIGHRSEFNDLDLFQFKIEQLQKLHADKILSGGYLEPRALYTSTEYDKIGNNGRESRSIHLGIDFWLPVNTAVHALFDGEVVTAVNDVGDKEYGGLVILKHRLEDLEFFTLYGHNTVKSALQHEIGDIIKKGEKIAELGNYPENGNWAPHLHFQVMLSMLDYKIDYPGVAYYSQLDIWKSLCPDPNFLFNSDALISNSDQSNEALITFREKHLGKSLSLQYKVPIKMVRGSGQYMMDQFGRKYLDTVNNVAHVGHEHPDVVKAGQVQMAMINTNSRYLHENINELAQELIKTLPDELNVLHFVNSGSEANELAIRMVKAATGQKDIIASEAGYHGNSNTCIDISSYKFDGAGGKGSPEHTQIFPLPDTFRGKYKGENSGEKYAEEVKHCIDRIHQKGRDVGALIVEPIISCGGQVELPKGFLKKAYSYVREAGGLCISDEVQTGCGRMGKTYWGFQLHDVIPDIVTIGKPLGNGHPLAAVVCTQSVANKFANGMEYFNTFGGNPVSCAIGAEVLKTVDREGLQKHALQIGNYLKDELKKLRVEFPIIGDVRGQGLFLGIELVNKELKPLDLQTSYLANRMKEHGILMSIDGPDHNVLKIKPPLVFSKQNAQDLIFYLQKILSEDFMTSFE